MAPDITQLATKIQQNVATYIPNNEQVRQSLLQSARELVAALETPADRMIRTIFCEPALFTTIRILIDLKVFKLLANSEDAKSAAEISKLTGADRVLLERLLKQVASGNFITETAPNEYIANETTHVMATTGAEGCVKDMFQTFKIYDGMPGYLKKIQYSNPNNKDQTAFQYAFNTDQHYFEYLSSPGQEKQLESFNQHMTFKTLGPKWFDSQQVMNAVFGDATVSKEDVLLVDVGGASGYDILQFHKAHHDMPGRLILQDLPSTIDGLDSQVLASQGVEAMSHDMFTPQPVKHAKVYYLKMVLHDWPDEQCEQVLSKLKAALKPGYSRILLNEFVVPDVKAGFFETSMDILMMAVHAAQERRASEWKKLVENVDGLKLKNIWEVEGALERVIEIEAA